MFAGGGEKPPEVTDVSGQDDDEDGMVPGFSYGSGPSGAGGGGGGGFGSGFGIGGSVGGMSGNGSGSRWWGRDEDTPGASSMTTTTTGGAEAGIGAGTVLPGGLSDGFGYRATPFGADDTMGSDDFIPGLGAAEHMGSNHTSLLPPVGPRQSGMLPPQEDMWSGGGGGSGGRNEDWGSGGGGGSGPGGRRGGGGGYYDRRGGPRRGRY